MITANMWMDLTSYGIPILVLGDSEQLPPIGDKFELIYNPDFHLTQISRQAADNPIIKLSMIVRDTGHYPMDIRDSKNNSLIVSWRDPKFRNFFEQIYFQPDMIGLCASNQTRTKINSHVRKEMFFKPDEIKKGERIICLRNDYRSGLMNGDISTIKSISDTGVRNILNMDLEKYNGEKTMANVHTGCFNQPNHSEVIQNADYIGWMNYNFFDFGYAISVHKSQGSEWNTVVLFDEFMTGWADDIRRKWLYTGITRAKERLLICTDFTRGN
jgi:exodeoxyribonuclease-5